MLPLVGIAAAVLPDLIKVLAGDKAGTIAADVAKAVQTTTGTSDPVAAKQKLSQDPQAAADLQVKLAQIAINATKAQNEEQDKARQDQLAQLKEELQASLQNTGGVGRPCWSLSRIKAPWDGRQRPYQRLLRLDFLALL